MLPEQKAYIYAWVDGVIAAGFRAGIYCSGIPQSKMTANIVTAEDIRQSAGGRQIVYWAINDACPPAPGCAFPSAAAQPLPKVAFASPRSGSSRNRRSAKMWRRTAATTAATENCYPPGIVRAASACTWTSTTRPTSTDESLERQNALTLGQPSARHSPGYCASPQRAQCSEVLSYRRKSFWSTKRRLLLSLPSIQPCSKEATWWLQHPRQVGRCSDLISPTTCSESAVAAEKLSTSPFQSSGAAREAFLSARDWS